MPDYLLSHLGPGQSSQFLIDEGQELLTGLLVTLADVTKDATDFIHGDIVAGTESTSA